MLDFYQVRIGTINLTSNGAPTGVPCLLEVTGAEDLLTPVAGSAETSASGEKIVQLVEWLNGKDFEVKISVLRLAEWQQLKTLITNLLENSGVVRVTGAGAAGDFDAFAAPAPRRPYSFGKFSATGVRDVTLRFYTHGNS